MKRKDSVAARRKCPVCGVKPPYGRTFHKACGERKARR